MPSAEYSWSVGPADSRLVRVLLYLAEGLAGGGFVSLGASMTILTIGASPGAVGLFLIFLFLTTRWSVFLRYVSRGEIRWEVREWISVRRWPWTVLLVGSIGGALLSLQLRSLAWVVLSNLGINQFLLFSGFICAGIALLLSSRGEIAPETLTLRYNERREVDLRFLAGVQRFSVGAWTVLWLSAPRGYDNRRAFQGIYIIPSETLERVWHVFRAGLDADVETPEAAGPSRTVIYAVIVLFGGSGLTLFAALSAGGKPLWFAGYLAFITFGLLGVIVVAAEVGII